MKLIGLSCFTSATQHALNTAYVRAFTRLGVVPVILPTFGIDNRETITQDEFNTQHQEHTDRLVDACDALVLTGGVDVNPTTFDEPNWGAANCDSERDMMEIALLTAFILANKPVMGICRGLQIAAQYMGLNHFQQDLGMTKELHQGLEREFKDRQEPVHSVYVRGAYRNYLRAQTGRADLNKLNVTSWHHQGLTLSSSGVLPKGIKTMDQYSQWLQTAIDQYEQAHNIDIISCTGMVIEGFERAENKIVCHQNHIEESGPKGLAVQYWLSRYVLAPAPIV